MLGFHKQMDNRIKLLEEILSFRMQGVEFDNGDMYVDGHKAASDVRDEFVSVTEKLMDELAQCYNVLPHLDINNTIDHRPEGDEKWFLENEKTVTQFCRKLAAERPLKDIRDEYFFFSSRRRHTRSLCDLSSDVCSSDLPEWRRRLCAVNHVDNTGRLQSVSREENPLYYDLISQFERKTGTPVILNTSFNENEPIV